MDRPLILKEVFIDQFRNFIDQRLTIDPKITVIVGKNDSGKSNLLNRMFEQFYNYGCHGNADESACVHTEQRKVAIMTRWQINRDASSAGLLRGLNNGTDGNIFEYGIDSKSGKVMTLRIDGKEGEYYEPPHTNGIHYLKPAALEVIDKLIIKACYLGFTESRSLHSIFHFCFFEPSPELDTQLRDPTNRKWFSPESTLIRLTGWDAGTRVKLDDDEIWTAPKGDRHYIPVKTAVDEVESRLRKVSEQVTKALQKYWTDMPAISVSVELAGNDDYKQRACRDNHYMAVVHITDAAGMSCSGDGVKTFLALLLEVVDAQLRHDPKIMLFDEPGAHLHISAQKAVLKLLNDLSRTNQVIYATHSPFMIDWKFPQRVRLLERDPNTRKTTIINKPYGSSDKYMNPWDHPRHSIGVTVGDIGFLESKNVLVEGVSDQILIANVSAIFEQIGNPHLAPDVQVIPFFANDEELTRILKICRAEGKMCVVVHDGDTAGSGYKKIADSFGMPTLSITDINGGNSRPTDIVIEDLFEVSDYLNGVNAFYGDGQFDWFKQNITTDELKMISDGTINIATRLDNIFKTKFTTEHQFNKVAVATHIANTLQETPTLYNLKQFEVLFESVNKLSIKANALHEAPCKAVVGV